MNSIKQLLGESDASYSARHGGMWKIPAAPEGESEEDATRRWKSVEADLDNEPEQVAHRSAMIAANKARGAAGSDLFKRSAAGSKAYGSAYDNAMGYHQESQSNAIKRLLGEEETENGYIAYYRGKQMEVHAPTSYAAQKKAAEAFKAKKSWEVTVVLAERGGKPVTHSTTEIG